MSVCFSTRSSLRSQRKEREKGGKMSLFSLKKHSLSLSLSLQLFLFLSSICFGCRFVFFSSLLHFFSLGEIKVCGLLSLFPLLVFGGRSDKHIRSSLSLSSKKRAFWKTPTKPDDLPEQRVKREIIVFERSTPEDSFARERSGRKKKDGLDFSSHCGTNRSHTEENSRVKETKTHTSENKSVRVRVWYLASAPAGHASKIHSSVALLYTCVCIFYVKRDLSSIHAFVYISTRVVFEYARAKGRKM